MGEGLDTSNIGAICETAVTETLAAHSEGNTPYKLRPASEKVQNEFEPETLNREMLGLEDYECVICKDEMEDGCRISLLKKCKHCFHAECFLRWIKLQGWCPVCRTNIDEHQLNLVNKTEIVNTEQVSTEDEPVTDYFVVHS